MINIQCFAAPIIGTNGLKILIHCLDLEFSMKYLSPLVFANNSLSQ